MNKLKIEISTSSPTSAKWSFIDEKEEFNDGEFYCESTGNESTFFNQINSIFSDINFEKLDRKKTQNKFYKKFNSLPEQGFPFSITVRDMGELNYNHELSSDLDGLIFNDGFTTEDYVYLCIARTFIHFLWKIINSHMSLKPSKTTNIFQTDGKFLVEDYSYQIQEMKKAGLESKVGRANDEDGKILIDAMLNNLKTGNWIEVLKLEYLLLGIDIVSYHCEREEVFYDIHSLDNSYPTSSYIFTIELKTIKKAVSGEEESNALTKMIEILEIDE